MTLIVTAASAHCAIQVADTRVSYLDGRHYDDNLVKTTIVHCRSGKLAVSYTGAASLDNTRVDKWLTRRLREFEAWLKSPDEIVEFVRSELTAATHRNTHLCTSGLGLTVVFAGLGVGTGERPWPRIAEVSNQQRFRPDKDMFERVDPPMRAFNANRLILDETRPPPSVLTLNGAMASHFDSGPVWRRIRLAIPSARTTHEQMAVARLMVELVRHHRKTGTLARVIGEHCTSVIIQTPNFRSISSFHAGKNGVFRRIPNIVGPGYSIEDLEQQSNSVDMNQSLSNRLDRITRTGRASSRPGAPRTKGSKLRPRRMP